MDREERARGPEARNPGRVPAAPGADDGVQASPVMACRRIRGSITPGLGEPGGDRVRRADEGYPAAAVALPFDAAGRHGVPSFGSSQRSTP